MPRPAILLIAYCVVVFLLRSAPAADAFYSIPLQELTLTEGEIPDYNANENRNWQRFNRLRHVMYPRVVLDGEGEAYAVNLQALQWQRWRNNAQNADADRERLAVRAPSGSDVVGRLFLPNPAFDGMVEVKFKIAADAATDVAREEFYKAKGEYLGALLGQNPAGRAWFRRELNETAREAGLDPSADVSAGSHRRQNDFDKTFALVSGGRALSENLDLDDLQVASESGKMVDLDSLEGITIPEVNWDEILTDEDPEFDALAHLVPADQYALFFPDFAAFLRSSDEAREEGTPFLQLASQQAIDALTRERYEHQLGLTMSIFSRLFGHKFIKSVAVTGSDLYLRTGSDVAVVFESDNPAELREAIEVRRLSEFGGLDKAEKTAGEEAGIAYSLWRSSDRSVCSYLAEIDGAVVVTNSTVQLRRIAAAAAKELESISETSDYRYFRQIYPLEEQHTGLLVLTDHVIRRWCGPRWRILTSRRTRAAALLADYHARHAIRLANGDLAPGTVYDASPMPGLETLNVGPGGITSPIYGSLDFQTPIAELELERVSEAEAEGYRRFHRQYTRRWQRFFDPIAISFDLRPDAIDAELSVLPMTARSEYRDFLNLTQGAQIAADAADRHDGTLVHFAMSLNPDSELIRMADGFASSMSPGGPFDKRPFGWLGHSIAIYADESELWQRWVDAVEGDGNDDLEDVLEEAFETPSEVPVALWIDVRSGIGLTAFLTAVRGFIEQSSPGMTIWDPREYEGEPYVKVAPTERALGRRTSDEEYAVYYASTGRELIVTMNEPTMLRALSRAKARREGADEAAAEGAAPESPWLGDNVCFEASSTLLQYALKVASPQLRTEFQLRSWTNLPILNVWHRLFPDADPVDTHERIWGERPLCPGGGEYVWNDDWQTMESTAYGHPGAPKDGPAYPARWNAWTDARFGVTFEHDGLRARSVISRSAK